MKMRIFTILFLTVIARMAFAQHPIDNIVELLHQGEIVYAEKLLAENLQHDAQDIDSRMLLGTVTDFTGHSEEAIKIWSEGLSNTEADFPLYMSIGEIRMRQGLQGSNVRFVNGLVQYSAMTDSAQDMRYRNHQLKMAVEAFQQAHQLYPYEGDPLIQLATVWQHLRDFDKALQYWKSIAAMYPADEEYMVAVGNCELQLRHYSGALQSYQQAIALNPRLAAAYYGLADYSSQMHDWKKAGEFMQMAEFYKWLPPFCNLEYSTEHYEYFITLAQTDEDSPVTLPRLKLIEKLMDQPSEVSTELLVALCWYHQDHGELEGRMLDELTHRDHTLPLLFQLARQSESPCLIRGTVRRLVAIEAPGVFDLMVELLSRDREPFNPTYIAENMAALGDDRAIAYLVREASPQLVKPEETDPDYLLASEGVRSARCRAVLALSAFRHPVAQQALHEGLSNPNIAPYCGAALYKVTGNEEFLDYVEEFAKKNKKDQLLAGFFKNINTKAAHKLFRKFS